MVLPCIFFRLSAQFSTKQKKCVGYRKSYWNTEQRNRTRICIANLWTKKKRKCCSTNSFRVIWTSTELMWHKGKNEVKWAAPSWQKYTRRVNHYNKTYFFLFWCVVPEADFEPWALPSDSHAQIHSTTEPHTIYKKNKSARGKVGYNALCDHLHFGKQIIDAVTLAIDCNGDLLVSERNGPITPFDENPHSVWMYLPHDGE